METGADLVSRNFSTAKLIELAERFIKNFSQHAEFTGPKVAATGPRIY